MTTVLVTGAGGFIARHLALKLQAEGWRVVGTTRTPVAALPGYQRVACVSLGESLLPLLAEERVDAVVHTALAAGAAAYALNVEGTTRWLEEGRAAGAPLQVLLGTLSAQPEALSPYGRAKWTLEQRFVAADEVVLRLGVVVGNGGMFARIRRSATRGPLTPLVDGGQQPLYLVSIETVCNALRDAINRGGAGLRGRAWNLVQPEPVALRRLIEAIQQHDGHRALLLPVPLSPVLWAVRVLESLPGLRLPVGSANLHGLRQQSEYRVVADWEHFGYPVQSLEAMLSDI